MKKLSFYLFAVIAFAVSFTSCDKDDDAKEVKITFEDVTLNSDGFENNFTTGLVISEMSFYNKHEVTTYEYWEGFAVSQNTDTTDMTLTNQYSVYGTGGDDNSKKFAVAFAAFDTVTSFGFTAGKEKTIQSLMLNNSTYTAQVIKNGNTYANAFKEGDYFKVKFTGYNAQGNKTDSVEVYLADYQDGKSFVLSKWSKINLNKLGKVNAVGITFESTDVAYGYINTPQYVCIDNIIYVE